MEKHRFTPEQIAFLKSNVKGCQRKTLTDMFNEYFGLQLRLQQIIDALKHYRLFNGLRGGTNYQNLLKKQNTPLALGTERTRCEYGEHYVVVKIGQPNIWQPKHIFIWEAMNGPIPDGHIVIFGDNNKMNFDDNNLLLISRRQFSIMINRGLLSHDIELTKAGITVADLYIKLADLRKENKGGK